jgi:Ca-activated chloride channel family protein
MKLFVIGLHLVAASFVALLPISNHIDVPTGKLAGLVTDTTDAPLAGATIVIRGTRLGTATNSNGEYFIEKVPAGTYSIAASLAGMKTVVVDSVEITAGYTRTLNFRLPQEITSSSEVVTEDERPLMQKDAIGVPRVRGGRDNEVGFDMDISGAVLPQHNREYFNTEDYGLIKENEFRRAMEEPLSTFSIDVDGASYTNIRRFLGREGVLPPVDAVRIEEMINYFVYDYPKPEGNDPFSIVTEVGTAPWNKDHRLVHIGLQGKPIPSDDRPVNNLVFLLDVSGSMRDPYKLPLLKQAFRLLVDELGESDRVAITVYAGAAGLVLPSTPGTQKDVILDAITRLEAGGTTAGAAGIRLAYQVAQQNFVMGGNNRVILATDGDFNVGVSSDAELTRLIEEKRESGVFLTVLGFGTGNIKDNKMEQIANHGNGNYYYIDSQAEARKVLVSELGSTLFAIAKDVKIQVEFNPLYVQSYRLIGYENRLLANEDFNDDKKDAGELGAGHTVTALYEIVPADGDVETEAQSRGELKYSSERLTTEALTSGDLMSVSLRYKRPDEDTSHLIERTVRVDAPESKSEAFLFASAVAEFGMILRDSKHKGASSINDVLALANRASTFDPGSYRASFIQLVNQYVNVVNGRETTLLMDD